jgi:predicted amidophosphoribosyltransferase
VTCRVCSAPLWEGNTSGACARCHRTAGGSCRLCGGPIAAHNRSGYCASCARLRAKPRAYEWRRARRAA